MPTAIQRRGGTASAHTSFAGAARELTVNTDNNSVHVHDGSTAGGFELARADLSNISQSDLDSLSSSITAIFQRSATQPGTPDPSSTTPTGWYADADNVPSSSDPLWYAFGTKAAGETNFVWQTPIRAEGADGADGAAGAAGDAGTAGARHAEVYMFYNQASASAPTAPTTAEVSYNFSTSAASVTTSGWSVNFNPAALTSDNTANNKYWAVKVTFQEDTFGGTITETISPVFTWLNFDGLVTFTNLDAGTNENGTSTTYIDGGSIKTNSIETSALQADFIQVGNAASDVNSGATTISGDKITTGTLNADRIQSNTTLTTNSTTFGLGTSTTFESFQSGGQFVSSSSSNAGLLVANTNTTNGHGILAGTRGAGSDSWAVLAGGGANSTFTTFSSAAGICQSGIAANFNHTGGGNISLGQSNYAYYINGGIAGPFTGSHDALIDKTDTQPTAGDILVDTEVVAKKGVNDTITKVQLSSSADQPAVIGVFSANASSDHVPTALSVNTSSVAHRPEYEIDSQYSSIVDACNIIAINSIGEGQINVCGEGGDIAAGDLIVTSSTAGKGMKQSDDIVRSKTVAKAREAVTFSSPSEVQQIACIYLCG